MNALATDQARRTAETIHRTPSLRGRVSAGLYVGEGERSPHTPMGPDHVITDRATLRERPPDILLTNYKMLDFLLIRPMDHRLWRHNESDTLRYLVVDELHTFDGAQGTDLACLVRRLRSRLGTTRERLICVGTSATIGAEENHEELLAYVSRIFDQPFEADSIVGEVRQSIDEFLGTSLISRSLLGHGDLGERVDHTRYATVEEYVRAQHEVFLGESINGEFVDDGWPVALAERLREHLTFVNLLRVLEGRPKALREIIARHRHCNLRRLRRRSCWTRSDQVHRLQRRPAREGLLPRDRGEKTRTTSTQPGLPLLRRTGGAHHRRRAGVEPPKRRPGGRCGIDIRGRSRKLRLNYRTTEETRRWASHLLSGRDIDDLDGGADDNEGIRSLTRGPEPLLKHFGSREDHNEFVARYLHDLEGRGQALRAVCIVARTVGERNSINGTLQAQGTETTVIERETTDDGMQGGVRLATMHRVKGLEFERVVMASVNRGLVPLSAAVDGRSDAAAQESAETEERALVYVAATRARKELLVLSYGAPSPLVRRD